MSESPLYLGLDVGGTKCAAVLGDETGAILQRVEWPSHAQRGPDAMIADMVRHGSMLLAGATPRPRAAGVSIGGPLDASRGVILSPPNLPGWDNIALGERLAAALGCCVSVMHDATACALAEHRWGAGRGCEHVVYLTCGTGFGAGFVLGGRPYYGAAGRASDIGHIRMAADGPIGYGRPGTVEGFCAGSALSRIAALRFPARWGQQPPAPPEIARLWLQDGDADAAEVCAISAQAVGRVCAALADTLYPEAIILGSLSRYLGERWLKLVQQTLREEAMPEAARLVRLTPPALGDRLQDCSALSAAMTQTGR